MALRGLREGARADRRHFAEEAHRRDVHREIVGRSEAHLEGLRLHVWLVPRDNCGCRTIGPALRMDGRSLGSAQSCGKLPGRWRRGRRGCGHRDEVRCGRIDSGRRAVTSVLGDADQEQWEQDGWCVVRNLLPSETITAAREILPGLFPTAEEFADGTDPARNEPFRIDSHRVMPRFPFDDAVLNDIVVHDLIIDLAEQLLGLGDLRLYQAMLSAKYGEGALSDEQLLHVDYGNHTLVVPRHEPGYQQLELFVYLSDVTEDTGATRMVSRRLTPTSRWSGPI